MYKQKINDNIFKIKKRKLKIYDLYRQIRRLKELNNNSQIELEKYQLKEKKIKYIHITGLEWHIESGYQHYYGKLSARGKKYRYLSDIIEKYNFDSAIVKYEILNSENTTEGFRVETFTRQQLIDMDQQMKNDGRYD